jgi:hypothetical protein
MGTTRRAVLGGALMGALANVAAVRSLAASSFDRHEAVLYAYPGTRAGTTVLAARWSSGPGGLARIHAGSQSWDLQVADREAAVLEVSNERLAGGKGLWAEKLTRAGARHRVGSPFLTALVAEDDTLARLYHSGSPAEDRGVMQQQVAWVVAARARRGGRIADPEAHGRRLAATLLPDVLYYDPAQPPGFTFAQRNGRNPAEEVGPVVSTLLGGHHVASL